jgi:heme A synthase
MSRFWLIFVSMAFALIVGLGFRLGWELPDASRPELVRRFVVVALIFVGLSTLVGITAVLSERLQGWIDRKNDPLRRLGWRPPRID